MSSNIRILVVDDDPLHARALEALGQGTIDIQSATSVDSYRDYIAKYRDEIDLIVMDLMLDSYTRIKGNTGTVHLDGLDMIRDEMKRDPTLKIIVFTQFGHTQTAIECYRSGVMGYLPKSLATDEEIEVAINTVASGKHIIREGYSPIDYNRIVTYTTPELRQLTQNEIDVIGYIYSGLSYQEISDRLELKTEQSFRNKVSRLLKKTPWKSMSDALIYAGKSGFRDII